ncbi:MAG: HDIG domain-containing protein [Bacteroidetes bacterium]|nr:HDIG domain-containing protein [Bacteroidota bacterium]MBK8362403.1 HDIG domain-containing protein [Bacteroidota bacterium]MBK9412887.1 HDIG domain-containing protein [Bacteroidota bacterium]MBP6426009.1 HDIG domain-containing protein [Bacteroidia bacterium]MBP6657471.1 HDIG domain-containing protein [Bacteroidia bacterium]
MKNYFVRLSNQHERISKIALIIVTVLMIVIALPKETQFNYTFQKGKPWAFENLMAPFDFAINKTEAELNEEKASVMKNSHPFYRFDDKLSEQKIYLFKNELSDVWNKRFRTSAKNYKEIEQQDKLKQVQETIGVQVLKMIYDKGIILINDKTKNINPDGIITIVKDNIAEEHNLNDYYTIQTAFSFIQSQLENISAADQSLLAPLLENALSHNILYDDQATRQWTKQLIDKISLSHGLVQKDEVVILKGEIIDDIRFQKLESLKAEMKNQEFTNSARWLMLMGHFILVSLAMTMLVMFLFLFRKDIFDDNRRMLLLMLLIVLITYLFLWARKINLFDMYLVPVCILPIIVRAFFDTRTALFTHIVTLLIIGFEAPSGFEFMFIQTIAGMVSIFTILNMSRRVQFFISVLMIFLSYTISFVGVSILHEANFKSIEWMNLKWFLGNSVITLFAFPLIFIFEKAFGFLSDVSLMELSDSNAPLMRELSMKAPGSFQHSLQVANLAEAAIFHIGGNPLLIRAGAMYHDIGKTDMPMYFIENQNTHSNPHDDLSFEESARIIKSHVIRGIEKARKHKLPEQIIDFIRTHHGTVRLQYFYQSFLKNFPEMVPDEILFRYPGPLPFSKETAVLMMADSVEAASRSLKNADAESISNLVDSIIDNQITQKQFDNAPITLKDISEIKKLFKKMLMSIYHIRIEYPH